jgi:hypothetical protein
VPLCQKTLQKQQYAGIAKKKYAGEKNDKVVWLTIISSAEGKEGYVAL